LSKACNGVVGTETLLSAGDHGNWLLLLLLQCEHTQTSRCDQFGDFRVNNLTNQRLLKNALASNKEVVTANPTP
jgi:hypothetical protein